MMYVMQETLPTTEQAHAALELLQLNYTEKDHPYTIRGVLPYMRQAYAEPDELAEYIAPMRVANKATVWLQLEGEPEIQQAIHGTLPDQVDNQYYTALFEHVRNGAEISEQHRWLQESEPFPTWAELNADNRQRIAEAQEATVDTALPIGPHGDHRSRDSDIMTSALWMVCRKKAAAKHWPIATNPERIDDALHLASYINISGCYSRVASSILGALAKAEDETSWRHVYKTAQDRLQATYGGDSSFRVRAQHHILRFAMQRHAYQEAVDSEREAYALHSGELSQFSLAALCLIVERAQQNQ